MKELKGKKAVITGPVGNLGSAVVDAFMQQGANLILLDHRGDRLRKMYPEMADSTEHLLLSSTDLTISDQVETAIKKSLDKFKQIDILVHTAGGFQMGEMVHEISESSWTFLMDLNIKTLLNMTRFVVPQMLKQNSGNIVTIGARPSLQGKAKMGSYSVAKAGVLRLTESLSAELKTSGINVNCVLPGTIDTPQNRADMPKADTTKWVAPSSLASVILFLASEKASDIHGAAIPVYGA